MNLQFSPETIMALLGGFFSWFFARFPKVRVWFAAKSSDEKSLWMIGVIVVLFIVFLLTGITGLIKWYALGGVLMVWNPFPWNDVIFTLVAIIISNQGVYPLLTDTDDVKVAKVTRDVRNEPRSMIQPPE